MSEERVYHFLTGWSKGMALPSYIDGPFLSEYEARRAAIDWMASGKADVYSVMSTVPQKVWPDSSPRVAAKS